MNVARMLSRKSFRLSTFFVVFTIAAIGLYGVSRYIAAPRLTKFTTGGIRSDGYKWCVVCSGNQPVVVFVDYDKFSESDATWYRVSVLGPEQIAVSCSQTRLNLSTRKPLLITKRDEEPVRVRFLTADDIDSCFTSEGFLKRPLYFCKTVLPPTM